jgi:diacylglycerol kinase (ATP)
MSTPVPSKRTGLSRVLHAFTYSIDGLKTGWGEPAFRQEALLAIPLVPLAFVIGANWLETAMLIAVVVFVMVTELLNTAVEAAIDRIGPEWHAISKRAKDLGSAAVLLSLLLCGGVWLAALWAWW